jgi:hypothetical protein
LGLISRKKLVFGATAPFIFFDEAMKAIFICDRDPHFLDRLQPSKTIDEKFAP